jgi:flagellar hook-length control protein FliK
VTNPIKIGSSIANAAISANKPDRSVAPGAPGFAVLLQGALKPGNDTAANALGTAPVSQRPDTEAHDLDSLSDALGELLSLLTGLEQGIKDEQPLDTAAMETLAGLLETVNGLLDTGAVIAPDSPLLSQLRDLAKSLGIELGGENVGSEAVLESLSALATRMAAELRDSEPELASALTGIARRLDTHIASIEAALANARPDASMQLKLVESETKPNAVAAIAQSTTEKPAQTASVTPATPEKTGAESTPPQTGESARSAKSSRSFVGPEAQTRANPPQSQSGAQPNGASVTLAASASAEAQTDAPDGLTIPAGQSGSSTATPGAIRPETAAYHRAEPRINVPYIAVEIARSIQNGISRFEIRLNPPELGRVDVRLEMDQSGNVIARLAVEKSETLDLLQRDQRALEKALADAGIDTDKTDLEFSLREESDGNDHSSERDAWKASIAASPESDTEISSLPPGSAIRGYARLDAVNLWV